MGGYFFVKVYVLTEDWRRLALSCSCLNIQISVLIQNFWAFYKSTSSQFVLFVTKVYHTSSPRHAWRIKNFGLPLSAGQASLLNLLRTYSVETDLPSAALMRPPSFPCERMITTHIWPSLWSSLLENPLIVLIISWYSRLRRTVTFKKAKSI